MKKNLSILAASLLLLGLGACSEEKECSPLGDGTVKVTVYATRGEADTRSVLSEEGGNLNCAWQTGDQLLVTNANGGKLGHLELTDEATGKFEGQLVGLSEGKMNLNYFFLGTGVDCKSISEDKTRNNYTFDLSSQEGQLLSLGKYDALSASAEITVIGGKPYLDKNLQLNRHFSFAHFTLNFPEGVVLDGAPITITGLNTKATIGFADRALTEVTAGTVTVEGTDGDIFIGIIPGESVAPTFKATINGKEYEGSLDSRNIAAGVYLRKAAGQGVPVQMAEVKTEDHTKNPLLKWAEGNLKRSGTGANVIGTIESETSTGSYYQFGRNYGFNSVSDACNNYGVERSDMPSDYNVYPGTGSTERVNVYYADKITYSKYPNYFFIDNNHNGDYTTPDHKDVWTERAKKMGYTNDSPCPEGWRLPTIAEYKEIMPVIDEKAGNTGSGAWNTLVQFKTLADGTKCAFRWSKTNKNNYSYLKIECLVVNDAITDADAIDWSDENVQTRVFKGSGYIQAHRNLWNLNSYGYNSYQFTARPMEWGSYSMRLKTYNRTAVVVVEQSASYMKYGGFYWTSDAEQNVFTIVFNNATGYDSGYYLATYSDAIAANIRCVKAE